MPAFALSNRGERRRDHLFYSDDGQLTEDVARHLESALAAGGAGVAFITAEHERSLRSLLEETDLAKEATRAGRLVFCRAEDLLSQLQVEGRLVAERFFDAVGQVLASAAVSGAPLHVYSEMAGLLWETEELAAVAEMEQLFDELARQRSFELFTAYRPLGDSRPRPSGSFEQILGVHASLLEAGPSDPGLDPATQACGRAFPPEATAPAKVRAFVREVLGRWGLSPVDDAVLVASELATNAVVHAASPFWTVLARLGDGVRVSVKDETAFSDDREPDIDGMHGLGIVSGLSRAWGIERHDGGKTVWSELVVPPLG